MNGAKIPTPCITGLILSFLICAAPAYAQQQYQASLTGAQQVPAVASSGTGTGTVVLNAAETQITVNMSFSGLTTPAIAAHIHGSAGVGFNAGVLFDFSGVTPNATSGSIPTQTFAITPSQVADLKAGLFYFNIHTTIYGGGEIRGQIFVTMTATPTSLRAGVATNAAGQVVARTPCQDVTVGLPGSSANWIPTVDQPWVALVNAGGTGPGQFDVCINDNAGSLGGATSATATITITAAGINQAIAITLTLTIRQITATAAPFGAFDTPVMGASVAGSIPVTGWALDDVGVKRVEIWRDRVAGETTPVFGGPGPGTGKIFIADAFFISGARPDVEAQYSTSPRAVRAGWGYLLLTYGLFNQGNGTYVLYAFAYDEEGRNVTLGSKLITVTNATATRPFGSIDVPAYGETMTTNFYNFGWALTPNATPSCTVGSNGVQVAIDSGPLTPVNYGDLRPDIAAAFPGYTNSSGAGGAYFINTSTLSNGTHLIGWYVVDNCGRAEGIGSRFFNVLNGGSITPPPGTTVTVESATTTASGPARDVTSEPIEVRRGGTDTVWIYPSRAGDRVLAIAQSERVEVRLPDAGGRYAGHQLVNGEHRALPPGSSLDADHGIFYWQPATGFLGAYQLEFSPPEGGSVRIRAVVGTQVQAAIDTPAPGAVVPPSFVVSGWAVDLAAEAGPGIDTLHVWAQPTSGAPPVFLGVTKYGGARPDVGGLFGDQFVNSSFSLAVRLKPGFYDLVVYPHSAVLGDFRGAVVRQVTVR